MIINMPDLVKHLRTRGGKLVVCTSGGYDPIHPGHISCIQQSARLKGEHGILVVVVNGDEFLQAKKGKPFQNQDVRCRIVDAIAGVDYTMPFRPSDSTDSTVCEALAAIKPDLFTKGGDREPTSCHKTGSLRNIPEWKICQEHNIAVAYNVGHKKDWSSSDMLRDWKK